MNAVPQTLEPFLNSICPPPQWPSIRTLAPVSRERAQIEAQAAIIKRYAPPKTPIGQMEYVYRAGPLELICHLEYEEAERGLGVSPDLAATTILTAAYANGMDVSEHLDSSVVALIQIKAAAQLGEDSV